MTHAKVLKAAEFAEMKHRGQTRKDVEKTPYITHPFNVARIISDHGSVMDQDIISAALLHDTLEDTNTSLREIAGEFSENVAFLVKEVSDDKSLSKQLRKELQVKHAMELSEGAAYIKIADKISNVHDVAHNPPPDWNMGRRLNYLRWAEQVIANCPAVNISLIREFGKTLFDGLVSILEPEAKNGNVDAMRLLSGVYGERGICDKELQWYLRSV